MKSKELLRTAKMRSLKPGRDVKSEEGRSADVNGLVREIGYNINEL
jgi:hypothetical protein